LGRRWNWRSISFCAVRVYDAWTRGAPTTSVSVSERRNAWRASSSCRDARPPPAGPPVSSLQISSMVSPLWVNSSSLVVAQPARAATVDKATSPMAHRSIEFRDIGASECVIDLAAFGVVVEHERLLDVHGDFGAGLDIDGG